jgi:prephenate dehydrogenase
MINLHIIGLGLIGGSLAKALSGNDKYYVSAEDTNAQCIQQALECCAVSPLQNPADITLLATPSAAALRTLDSLVLNPAGGIFTDVCSVKQPIYEIALKLLDRGVYLIPAHPIAGRESSGFDSSVKDLFHGKKVILTPISTSEGGYNQALEAVTQLWRDAGGNVEIMDASTHDMIYAAVSHFVQLLSFAYRDILAISGCNIDGIIEGNPSFKEFTRLGNSSREMWRSIFRLNRDNLEKCLNYFAAFIQQLDVNDEIDVINELPHIMQQGLSAVCSQISRDLGVNVLDYAGSGYRSFNVAPIALKNAKETPIKISLSGLLTCLIQTQNRLEANSATLSKD